ncbi:MAG: UDP-N-acetylmuramate--L-alanine ligase [Proteobacteria bacterium]|nr:UDP-N-acetylmuramate--L-alanine ligase [Pseudomonadota bacterium]
MDQNKNLNSIRMRERIRRIHFVGIGGAGMSGIAEVLLTEGYQVTGSDLNDTAVTQHLKKLGAEIKIGHKAEHVENADVVVLSTAIQTNNPEVIAAKNLHIPIVPRAAMLAELMRFRYGIAVAGTHGKTTTTSLVTSILAEGNLDPTFVIGGKLNSAGCNARLGSGQYLVAEADESDASFLHLLPMVSIITNIDADHMETYGGDLSCLHQTFVKFIHNLPFYGLAVVCLDDPVIRKILPEISRPVMTYGFSEDADVKIMNYRQDGIKTYFEVQHPRLKKPLSITLNLAGRHNALNSLAAIIVGLELNVSEAAITKALSQFAGVGRRFQMYGEYKISEGSFLVVDDYGHHPREISSTVQAVREAWPDKRLVLVFQPHRYSRTQSLFEDFSEVLSETDLLMLLEIYPAGEEPIAGIDSRALCRSIRQRGKVEPIYISDHKEFASTLLNVIKPGDIVLTQGAGSIGSLVSQWCNTLERI